MIKRIPTVTIVLLGIAWLIALGWFASDRNFEPALTSVALLASISTLYLDFWVASRNRRSELLKGLVHECYENLNVFKDARFHPDWGKDKPSRLTVFPRLQQSTAEAVIASGSFYDRRDAQLIALVHKWRSAANDFNRRLDVIELCTFIRPTAEEIASFRRALLEGTTIKETRSMLGDLTTCLLDRYSKETEIDRETMLFEGAPPPHN